MPATLSHSFGPISLDTYMEIGRAHRNVSQELAPHGNKGRHGGAWYICCLADLSFLSFPPYLAHRRAWCPPPQASDTPTNKYPDTRDLALRRSFSCSSWRTSFPAVAAIYPFSGPLTIGTHASPPSDNRAKPSNLNDRVGTVLAAANPSFDVNCHPSTGPWVHSAARCTGRDDAVSLSLNSQISGRKR